VRTLDGKTLLDHGVPHELAMEVIQYARERDLHVQAYRDDMLIVERDRPEAHVYANHAGMQINVVGDLDKAMGPTTPKLVIVSTAEKIEPLLVHTRQHWSGKLNIATSVPEYLEFTSANSDKASALAFLCDQLGVSREESVA
jgi:hydroxymethylpyrimidine pyrophosphatase-like HAD family hydrolase